MMTEQRVWWTISTKSLPLLGTGWLTTQQEPRWNEGVAHWPIMFRTRKRAREESKALDAKYQYLGLGWKFHVTRLEVTYRAS